MRDLFRGELVRITSEEPETYAKAEVRWQRDSEFVRLQIVIPSSCLPRRRSRNGLKTV